MSELKHVDPTKVDPNKNTVLKPDPKHPGKFFEVEAAPKKTWRNNSVGGSKSNPTPSNKGMVKVGEYRYAGLKK